jgi:hypothetical protein
MGLLLGSSGLQREWCGGASTMRTFHRCHMGVEGGGSSVRKVLCATGPDC